MVMRVRVVWLALGAACLVWLAGCQTISKLSDIKLAYIKLSDIKLADPLSPQTGAADDQPTGSTSAEKPAPVTPGLLGENPIENEENARRNH